MVVLLGEFNGKSKLMPELKRHGFGRMWASYGPAWSYEGEPWGFDNGAYAHFRKGFAGFPAEKFLKRLKTAEEKSSYPPCVAVAPDMVGKGSMSLLLSCHWIERLPKQWPWFLAVQDGMKRLEVEKHIHKFAGLFLGGSDDFKRTAFKWCRLAHDHRKLFHYARCNREGWIWKALEIGADSIDTASPVWRYAEGKVGAYRRFVQLVTGQCPQKRLEFDYGEGGEN